MSDNSFQTFYEELKLLVEKFENKQTQIKVESDLDFDSIKIFGEKMDSVTRAKLGVEDAAELAYTTAEHHPYWGVLYNCIEITKTILEKSLKICEQTNQEKLLGRVYRNLGVVLGRIWRSGLRQVKCGGKPLPLEWEAV